VQAGAVTVGGVAAVVKDGEQIAAIPDGQAAGVTDGQIGVVAGQMTAHAEPVEERGRRDRGALDGRLGAQTAS